jgi:hypothetical protein
MSAVQEIKIQEFTRNTAGGRFTYAVYKGRIVRRAYGRGRPHYETVTGLKITEADKVIPREVNVTSQVAKALIGA